MKFECMQSDLKNAVKSVIGAVATKVTVPALEGLLIKAADNNISITGYNLEFGITTNINAEIVSGGAIVINAKLFSGIVTKLEKSVCIEAVDNIVNISSGNIEYSLIGMNCEDYPEIPHFDTIQKITISSDILKNMIKNTLYAVSDNMSKPIYTGSLFEIENGIFRIVAIDGYRMAIRSENVDSKCDTQFVVPGKTQREIIKLLDNSKELVEICLGQRHVLFKIDSNVIISRIIEGTFLDYKSTIPTESKNEITVNTRQLTECIERMCLINISKIQSPVICRLTNDEIRFSFNCAVGKANEIINTQYQGEAMEIGFNSKYMLDAVKNSDTDIIKLTLNGPLTPLIITPVKNNSFINLIVPMQLNKES